MLEKNVTKRRGKAKTKINDKRQAVMDRLVDSYSEEFDVKMAVIQELIPLGLQRVTEELQNEVKRLTGAKYSRGTPNAPWGKQNGSIYLRDQKFPIKVPRVRNTETETEVPLEVYERFGKPFADDNNTVLKLLHGLSTHKYHESSALAEEAFGISASNLSKRFRAKSADKLKELQERPLSKYDIVAILIDAKRYAKDGLMVAMAINMDGKKLMLGVEHIHSENSKAIDQWLGRLIERGLRFEEGILFIIDGSKGIRKAIEQRFREYGFIQRCQWHKRENVIAYLAEDQQAICRRRMKDAYDKTTYRDAKGELTRLYHELVKVNESAANSLLEGLEETLTLHQLGLSSELTKSLSTTNCMESVMSQMGQYTDKVDRWQNSNQILRWTAASLMDIEPRMRRIKGFNYLGVLRFKLQVMVKEHLDKKAGSRTNEQNSQLANVIHVGAG